MRGFIGILLLFSANLFSQGYTIHDYEVRLTVRPTADILVEERLSVRFTEERRGIIRQIPLVSEVLGEDLDISITDVEVPRYKSRIRIQNNILYIRIGSDDKYLSGPVEYIIRYRVEGSQYWTGDRYETFINAIGHTWDATIDSAQVDVLFPDGWDPSSLSVSARTGEAGTAGVALALNPLSQGYRCRSTGPIRPGSGISLGWTYPEGILDPPPPPASFIKRQGLSLIAIILSIIFFGHWWKKGRRQPLGDVELQSYPPQGWRPAELGAYVDHKADYRDIVAMIPQWGIEGNIRIQRDQHDIHIVRLQDLPPDAPEYERAFYDYIFSGSDHVSLDRVASDNPASLSRIRKLLHQEVSSRALWDRPSMELYHSYRMMIACCAFILAGFYFIYLGQILGSIIFFILALCCIAFYNLSPRFSEEGYDLYRHAMGYKHFLSTMPPDILQSLIADNPQYIEESYPYAIAFGEESAWTQGVEPIDPGPPSWYEDRVDHSRSRTEFNRHFDPSALYRRMAPASPESSSDSGHRSGGFSSGRVGGGSGGGGGSSW